MTWLNDCENCEIKDPFRRMWHGFNKICNEEERKLHNEWLRKVRSLSEELFLSEQSKIKIDLKKLVCKIPFFEGN